MARAHAVVLHGVVHHHVEDHVGLAQVAVLGQVDVTGLQAGGQVGRDGRQVGVIAKLGLVGEFLLQEL